MLENILHIVYNKVRKMKGAAIMRITEYAYAKINLYLDVLSKRDDGFHDIRSVMHSVDLCDLIELSAEPSDKTEIALRITSDADIPSGEDNIVFKAVRQYLLSVGITARVNINLKKSIPVEAGLGGGSSDAAAALRAMNRIFGKLFDDELFDLALTLGSDVPYCLVGGTKLCRGRGVPTSALSVPPMHVLIALGTERITAKEGYLALDRKYSDFDGTVSKPELSESEIISAFTPAGIDEGVLYNVFESLDIPKLSEVKRIKRSMSEQGAKGSLMSGSGPAVFGIFSTKTEAEIALQHLEALGIKTYLTQSI